MHERLERIDARLDELVNRVGYLERNAAETSVQIAGLSTRMDNFDRRLTRIERRLDLVEGPAP